MKHAKMVWVVAIGAILLILNSGICIAKDVELLIASHFDATGVLTQGSIGTGWEDYFKYVNEEKNGINGAKLRLTWRDDQYKADKTMAWYKAVMAAENKPLMFCPQHTTGAGVLKKLMQRDGISGLSLTPAGLVVYPPATIYTMSPTYQDQVAMYFDWILMNWKKERKPRFGWLNPDIPFGRESAKKEIKEYAEKVGIEIVGEEYVPPIPVDTSINLKRLIKYNKADFVYTNGTEATLLPLLRDAERLGLRDKVVWGTCTFVDIPGILKAARMDKNIANAAEGLFISFIFPQFSEIDHSGVKFMRELAQKYRGGLPSEETRGKYIHGVLEGIVVEKLLRLVAEKVPVEKMTMADMEKYGWWRMKDFDPKGLLGGAKLTYGKDMPRCGASGGKPLQIKGGKPVRLDVKLKPHGLP